MLIGDETLLISHGRDSASSSAIQGGALWQVVCAEYGLADSATADAATHC